MRMIAVVRMAVRMAMTMRVAVTRVVAIVEVMMHFRCGNSGLLQFVLETLFNPRVFFIRLDLLHI